MGGRNVQRGHPGSAREHSYSAGAAQSAGQGKTKAGVDPTQGGRRLHCGVQRNGCGPDTVWMRAPGH
eukprot:gene18277-biopygen867